MEANEEALKAVIAPLGLHGNEERLAEITSPLWRLIEYAVRDSEYKELAEAVVEIARIVPHTPDTDIDIMFFLRMVCFWCPGLREACQEYIARNPFLPK